MRLVMLAVVVAVSGCGSSAPPPESRVEGRLTFQGQPVAGGAVVFVPDRDRGFTGKPIRAETNDDGAFKLNNGGAVPPGWYRVALAGPPVFDAAALSGGPVFPPKLARPDQSGQAREVVAGRTHAFEFAVEVP
jgi:hypothetical protein